MNMWAKFANDFNAMSDEQIKRESDMFRDQLDEAEEWLEAVEAWKAAGSPRKEPERTKEKDRLIKQRDELDKKYPPEVYSKLKLEPEDVLRHAREVIRYGGTESEFWEIRWPSQEWEKKSRGW